MEVSYKDLLDDVSKELNVDKSVVEESYRHYWEYIQYIIGQMNFRDNNLTREEFNSMKFSVHLTNLGKLCSNYNKYCKNHRQLNINTDKNETKEN